jgi:hypothetical protein
MRRATAKTLPEIAGCLAFVLPAVLWWRGELHLKLGDGARNEALARELNRAVGLHGRDRRAASASKRARVNVSRAIQAASRESCEQDATLGRLLETTIRTIRRPPTCGINQAILTRIAMIDGKDHEIYAGPADACVTVFEFFEALRFSCSERCPPFVLHMSGNNQPPRQRFSAVNPSS